MYYDHALYSHTHTAQHYVLVEEEEKEQQRSRKGAPGAPQPGGGGAVRRPQPPVAAVGSKPTWDIGSEEYSTIWKFDDPGVEAAGLVDPELLDWF